MKSAAVRHAALALLLACMAVLVPCRPAAHCAEAQQAQAGEAPLLSPLASRIEHATARNEQVTKLMMEERWQEALALLGELKREFMDLKEVHDDFLETEKQIQTVMAVEQLKKAGKHQEALVLLREVEQRAENGKKRNIASQEISNEFGRIHKLDEAGNHREARPLAETLVRQAENELGEDSLLALHASLQLLDIQASLGEDSAREGIKRFVARVDRQFDPENSLRTEFRWLLSGTALRMNDQETAFSLLEDALRIAEQRGEAGRGDAVRTLEMLITLAYDEKSSERILSYMERLRQIQHNEGTSDEMGHPYEIASKLMPLYFSKAQLERFAHAASGDDSRTRERATASQNGPTSRKEDAAISPPGGNGKERQSPPAGKRNVLESGHGRRQAIQGLVEQGKEQDAMASLKEPLHQLLQQKPTVVSDPDIHEALQEAEKLFRSSKARLTLAKECKQAAEQALPRAQEQSGQDAAKLEALRKTDDKLQALRRTLGPRSYREALPQAQELARQAEQEHGPDSFMTLACSLEAANIHAQLEDLNAARLQLETLLPRYERLLGTNAPTLVTLRLIAGDFALQQGDYAAALPHYEAAERMAEERGEAGEKEALHAVFGALVCVQHKIEREIAIGMLLEKALEQRQHHQLEEAIRTYEQILAAVEAADGQDAPSYGGCLCQIGDLHVMLADYKAAEDALSRCLTILEKNFGPSGAELVMPLSGLAAVHKNSLQYARAIEEYERLVRITVEHEGPDSGKVMTYLVAVAEMAESLDYHDQAKALYDQAAHIAERQIQDEKSRYATSALRLLAERARAMGNVDQVRGLLRRVVDRARRNADPDSVHLANILRAQGEFLVEAGDDQELDQARELFEEARGIYAKTFDSGHHLVRGIEGELGELYLRQKRYGQARAAFHIAGSTFGEARVDLAEGRYDKVLQKKTFAIAAKQPIGPWRVPARITLGLAEEGLGHLAEAAEHFHTAILLLERQWYVLSPQDKGTFLDGSTEGFKRIEAYMGMIRVLSKLGEKDPQAAARSFEYAERCKSRALLALIARKNALAGIEDESETALELREAREHIQKLYAAEMRLTTVENRKEHLAESYREEILREHAVIKQAHDAFFAALEAKQPELASLVTLTEPVGAAEIQKLLSPDEALVEYVCFGPDTRVWVLRRDSVLVKRLDTDEATLNRALQALGAWEQSGKSRGVQVVGAAAAAELPAPMPDMPELGRLHQTLVRPIWPWIADAEQLIIVPHGALHRLPFAALRDGAESLVDQFAVTQAPSASVLRYMAAKRKPLGKPNQGSFLAFANPESERGPLPFAEAEVRAVTPFFGGQRIFAGPEATESQVKAATAGQDVVHFACHGAFDGADPLKSALFLGRDDKNDGRLELREIFQLNLKAAGLVTLSACETATNRVQGGDDVVGLSRGFLYAGSPSLLATLWPIDDRSVSLLMRDFYQNWRARGMSKAQALRRAQLALKADPRYASPYFWAPFVLIGDWKE